MRTVEAADLFLFRFDNKQNSTQETTSLISDFNPFIGIMLEYLPFSLLVL